jgi:glycosylphosphatidylinositol transamidase
MLAAQTSLLGHLCSVLIGYLREYPSDGDLALKANPLLLVGLGYLKFLVPPEKILRWIEGKLNLLGRLPHYVSVDQKTYGRFGVLPTAGAPAGERGTPLSFMAGSSQRLGQ